MQLPGVSLYNSVSRTVPPGGTYPPPDSYMKIRILPNRSRGGRCTEIGTSNPVAYRPPRRGQVFYLLCITDYSTIRISGPESE